MQRSGELTIRIEGGKADPDAGELAEFITLVRAVYNAGLSVGRAAGTKPTPAKVALFLRRDLAARNAKATNTLFKDVRPGSRRDALRTKRVSRESPLEIVFCGVIVVMAAAVVLAGGEVSLGPLKAKLGRGLGESIVSLRKALAPGVKGKVGYSLQPLIVTLSQSEFAELMRHDPSTRHRGGFQRKLIELQARTHQTKRTLTLYPDEVDWIRKYGSNPSSGGWQQSIRKIFGRHLWSSTA